jgi:hypothetical protein
VVITMVFSLSSVPSYAAHVRRTEIAGAAMSTPAAILERPNERRAGITQPDGVILTVMARIRNEGGWHPSTRPLTAR